MAVSKKNRAQLTPLGGLRQVLVVPDITQPFDRRLGMPPGPSMMAAPEDKQVQVHHACGHGLLGPPLRTTRSACTVSSLPSSRSSPRTSMLASLARWGAASAARLCPLSLSVCPPPHQG